MMASFVTVRAKWRYLTALMLTAYVPAGDPAQFGVFPESSTFQIGSGLPIQRDYDYIRNKMPNGCSTGPYL